MTPMMASTATQPATRREASGKSGRQKRIIPYVPIFSSTPASITEPAVGASTCASGSQVCSGKSGTLIANARKNARKRSISVLGASSRPPWDRGVCNSASTVGRSNVPVALYSQIIPTSIRIEPAIVYSTNFTAAYTRRSCPQIPIRNAMGISITSQKRKKRKRSSERNTPTTPTSSISSITKNSLTRCSMPFHDAKMEIGVRNVVRITRNKLIPSTPRW